MSKADRKPSSAKPASIPPLDASVYRNSFVDHDQAGVSTGIRSFRQRFEARFRPTSEPNVAEWFLTNTRLRRDDVEMEHSISSYFTDVATVMLSLLGQRRASKQIALKDSVPMRMALSEAIRRRRTRRSFTGDPIDFAHLSTILDAANGITAEPKVDLSSGGSVTYRYRTTASAGGLYPIELYVASCNLRGLSQGIYRHDPVNRALEFCLGADTISPLLETFCLPEHMVSKARAGAIILLVAHPWRTMLKYGPRGMRFVFIEAGAIAQNVELAAGALGYASVACASVYDDELHEVIGVDGVSAALVHAVVIGCPG